MLLLARQESWLADKKLQKKKKKEKKNTCHVLVESKDYKTDELITKTRLYNVDPLQPHFYIATLGFTGVYINFLISAQKHRLLVLVRTASPRRF